MKDPKVTELVKQFKNEISQVNKTWHKLQDEGMWVDVSTEGTNTYAGPKSFVIKRMTQSVDYFKDDA